MTIQEYGHDSVSSLSSKGSQQSRTEEHFFHAEQQFLSRWPEDKYNIFSQRAHPLVSSL